MAFTTVVLQMKPGDEVGIALCDIREGAALSPFPGTATTDIPFGHKVALRALATGDVIRTSVKDIRTVGRNTMGVTVKKVAPGEKVASVARALAETKEEKVTESAPTEVNVAPAERPAPDAEPRTGDGEDGDE